MTSTGDNAMEAAHGATAPSASPRAPLKLYWWNGEPNFGDAISQIVTAHVSGREVEWAAPKECDLFAVGSILLFARRAHGGAGQGYSPWVWGSGCIGPQRIDFVKNVRFAAVRGPLTATQLGIDCWTFGDPGLLIADAMGETIEPGGRIGVVPHHSHSRADWVRDLFEGDDRFLLIDPSSENPRDVVRQIASCRYVLSSSLHGLIVADSYGIPNTWITPKFNHGTPFQKFFDYALSVGRIMERPLEYREILGFVDRGVPDEFSYGDNIAAVKRTIASAFPDELRAAPRGVGEP
ncbi:MAG: polysaccharide pyruvyl transferase family protein [Pikeienuella sp.]